MTKTLTALAKNLSRVRPWAAVAMIVVAGLLAYDVHLGLRYWDLSGQASDLSARARQLRASIGGEPPHGAALADTLAEQDLRRGELGAQFIGPGTDVLVRMLFTAARDAGVDLRSISIGTVTTEMLEDGEYMARPTALALRGETASIYRFLSSIRRRTPAVSVTSIRVAGVGTSPSANLQLQFYMAPWSAPEK